MFTEHQKKLVLMKVTNLSKDLLIKSSGGSAVKVTNLHPSDSEFSSRWYPQESLVVEGMAAGQNYSQ